MNKQSDVIFKTLRVIAGMIFIALCIEAGALLVNFVYSLFNPLVLKNLYQKLDLSDMYQRSKSAYFTIYTFILFIAILKSVLFYFVIQLVTKLDLQRPFSKYVSEKITIISYTTLIIGMLSYVARQTTKYLDKRGYDINRLNEFWVDSQAFILMAAVVYIIAVIFKRGIELQTENDSTI